MPIGAYRQHTDTYRQPIDILIDAYRQPIDTHRQPIDILIDSNGQPIDTQVTTDEKTHGEKRNINLISFLAKVPGDLFHSSV